MSCVALRTLGAEGAADLEAEASVPPVRGAEDPAMDTPSAFPGKLRYRRIKPSRTLSSDCKLLCNCRVRERENDSREHGKTWMAGAQR